ncbi:MAG: serine hydrolase [Micavibrio sp.]|nr:serine hydrolase [Micavibrio sp.]
MARIVCCLSGCRGRPVCCAIRVSKSAGPNERALGHSGWGGSCVMADPEKRLSVGYVMNKQSAYLIGDPRPVGLINALYTCL